MKKIKTSVVISDEKWLKIIENVMQHADHDHWKSWFNPDNWEGEEEERAEFLQELVDAAKEAYNDNSI